MCEAWPFWAFRCTLPASPRASAPSTFLRFRSRCCSCKEPAMRWRRLIRSSRFAPHLVRARRYTSLPTPITPSTCRRAAAARMRKSSATSWTCWPAGPSIVCSMSRRPKPQRQRDEPKRADSDAPPGEQGEAVARYVAEQRLDHEPAADERDRKTDGDDPHFAAGELGSALVGFKDEGADHRGHGQPE